MNIFVLLKTKEYILKNVGNSAVLGHFHRIFSYYGRQSMVPKTAWLQTFFKISSFVFGRTKNFIQVWNYLRVGNWWQNLIFWVNYPFKSIKKPHRKKWANKIQILRQVLCCKWIQALGWRKGGHLQTTKLFQLPISLLLVGHPVRKTPACLGDIVFSKVQCHGISVFIWR